MKFRDLGLIDDIDSVKKKLKQRHQTLFFSATINPKIKKLAYSQISSSALRIQVSPEKMVSKNVTHSVVKVEMTEKRYLLINFIAANPEAKCIIFVRTQVRVERVAEQLAKKDITVLCMHGGMEQSEREKNLELFRKQKTGWLITTDVTARGIDLPTVTHVINYDIPDEPENYVHRVGRTGRGFAKGDAISFYSPEEKPKLDAIEEFIQTKIPQMKVHKEHLEAATKPDTKTSIAEMIAAAEAEHKNFKRRKKTK